jgi:hypothetical protein
MSDSGAGFPAVDAVHVARMNTAAGQCVVAFDVSLACGGSVDGEGPSLIERAAEGDAQARDMALQTAGVLGGQPRTIELVIDALVDAKRLATEDNSAVTMPLLLAALVPRLEEAFCPGIDMEWLAQMLLNTRRVERYLLNRVNREVNVRPTEAEIGTMFDFAAAASLDPSDLLDERPLRWVNEQRARWLQQAFSSDGRTGGSLIE